MLAVVKLNRSRDVNQLSGGVSSVLAVFFVGAKIANFHPSLVFFTARFADFVVSADVEILPHLTGTGRNA